MKICSREYELKINKNVSGGCFYTNGKYGKGTGLVELGDYDLHERSEILVHEIIEAVLVEDGKRFVETDRTICNERYLFVFDHNYLDTVGQKVLEALLTSGYFSLKEPKKRRKARVVQRKND